MIDQYPLVSIITICLNSIKTIKHAVECVFAQTYPNIEYIVVDGGSTDGTYEYLSSYRNKIASLVSERDSGPCDALNKGIQKASGRYIQLLMADDYFPPNKIEISVKLLLESPEVGFVFGNVVKIDPMTKKETLVPGDPNYSKLIQLTMPRLNSTTILAQKCLYDRYGLYDLHWIIANDYDWLLRISKAGVKGLHSNKIVTFMYAGGVSDKEVFDAFREVRDISIRHGLNPFLAYAYYCARCVKQIIYKVLSLR